MNIVNLSGTIVRDAKIGGRGDRRWARFTLAVEGGYDKETKQRKTEFVPCVYFVKADRAGALDLIQKGVFAEVERGRIETRKFEGKTGEPVRLTEVVVEQLRFPRPSKRAKAPKNFEIDFQGADEMAPRQA